MDAKESKHIQVNNRYILREKIGQGGMGIVYRSTDRLTGENVALKQVRMSSEQVEQPQHNLRLALAQEFQILAGLRHPHIISVLDYGFDQGRQPFFTMQYLPEAQTILEAGVSVDTASKVGLIRQMLQALAYLHRRGIIHRDLKPSNVLISGETVRILDFGLSIQHQTQLTSTGGSIQYMAPELLRQADASEASDLYAVGVIAFELLAGGHPFDTTSQRFMMQILNQEPNLLRLNLGTTFADLSVVIGCLLSKVPEDRYRRAEDCLAAMNDALQETVTEESVSIRESYLQAATFVGRNVELGQLQTALHKAKEGQSAVWLIGGESGVGKSRLLNELRTFALVDGWQVLTGQAIAEGGASYQLWQDIVPRLALNSMISDLEAGVLYQVIPALEPLFEEGIPAPPELTGESARQRFISTLMNLLRQQTKPTLLLLEDLQWTRESLLPLKQIIRILPQLSNVLIIGTYRHEERPDLPTELTGAQRLMLDRLAEEQIAELSKAMLGEQVSTPQIVALLTHETEGNTFFMVEVMRALAEEAGQLENVGRMSLPGGVFTSGMKYLLQRRLSGVPLQDQNLLRLAAVAGRQLDLRLIKNLADAKIGHLDDWLHRCSEAAILTVREGQWWFAHDKLRESLTNQLSQENRQDVYHQVATTIEQTYDDLSSWYVRLMYHWHQANNSEKERHYAYLAGLQASEQYINQEAEIFLSRAFDLTPEDNKDRQFETLLVRERVYKLQGKRESQQQDLGQLAELAKNRRNRKAEAEVTILQIEHALETGDYDRAQSLVKWVLDLPVIAQDDYLRLRSYQLLGEILAAQTNFEAAQTTFEQAIVVSQKIDAKAEHIQTLYKLGHLMIKQTRIDEAQDYFQAGFRMNQDEDDPQHRCIVLEQLSAYHFARGQYSETWRLAHQSLALARKVGDRQGEARLLANMGFLLILEGLYDQSYEYSEAALVISQEIDNRRFQGLIYNNLGEVSHRRKLYVQAQAYFEQSIVLKREIGVKWNEGQTHMQLGHLAYDQAEFDEADIHFHQAESLLREVAFSPVLLECRAGLAAVAMKRGDRKEARQIIDEIWPKLIKQDFVGEWHPFKVCLIYYQICQTLQDDRADIILDKAYRQLQKRAVLITHEPTRRSFLENVDEHREIIRLSQSP